MGIYSTLEDKWYSLIDAIDSKIPITGIIDKVDNVVPSFILFLIIIFLLVFLICFSFVFNTSLGIEVLVTNQNGIPLENALVLVNGLEEYYTDESGKVLFLANTNFSVDVSKNGYNEESDFFNIGETNRVSFKLNEKIVVSSREINVLVVDKDNDIINAVNLDFVCDGVTQNFSNQTQNGFVITTPSCSVAKLIATSSGFERKEVSITNEQRVIIELDYLATKGKILFKTMLDDSTAISATITLIDEDGKLTTVTTSIFGEKNTEIKAGEYTYTAEYEGHFEEGSVTIFPNENDSFEIVFDVLPDQVDEELNNSKYLKILVEDTSGIPLAGSKITVLRNNLSLSPVTVGVDGKYSKKISEQYFENNFIALVENIGYEKALVQLDLKETNQDFQKIVLGVPGSKLTFKIINDKGDPEKKAVLSLKNKDFNFVIGVFESDVNGIVIVDNLPAGQYTVSARDYGNKDFVEQQITVQKNTNKEIELLLRTGQGSIKYYFYDIFGEDLLVKPNFYLKENELWEKQIVLGATAKTFTSQKIKSGTNAKLKIEDSNFDYEDFVYTLTRENLSKKVYLVEEEKLANTSLLQMSLSNVFSSNPIYSNASIATKIEDSKSYFVLFQIILNNTENADVIGNFSVENNLGVKINGAYSIENSVSKLSSSVGGFLVENNIVDIDAKQANIVVLDQQGKKSFPVLLEIKVDENSTGNFNIVYQAKQGLMQSFEYKKEFFINERFCIENCPVFLFSNKLNWNGVEKLVDNEETQIVYLGDDYSLDTSVTNISDKDFAAVSLTNIFDKSADTYISFENDLNSKSFNLTLTPFATAQNNLANLEIKKAASAKKLYQRIFSSVEDIEDYAGNNNQLKFAITQKKRAEISISPNTLFINSRYPYIVVKTKYASSYIGVSMNFEVLHNSTQIYFGNTDENGLAIIQLDFSESNFLEGDEIKFVPSDEIGSIQIPLVLTLKNPVPVVELDAPECLSININGSDFSKTNDLIDLQIGESKSIVINSSCDEERLVRIITDLEVSSIQETIPANSSVTINVVGKTRDNILGAYPLQILSINGSKYSQLALMDIIVNDPSSCFALETAVFDLKNTDLVSSKIVNKCYSGRSDNYHPQMNISTNSVSLSYKKPGNPSIINFSPVVKASAIEAILYGFIKSDLQRTSSDDDGEDPHNVPDYPTEAFSGEQAQEMCEEIVEGLSDFEMIPKPKPEYVPAPGKEVVNYNPSEIVSQEGSTSSVGGIIETQENIEAKEQKENKIFLEIVPNSRGYVTSLSQGNFGEGATGELMTLGESQFEESGEGMESPKKLSGKQLGYFFTTNTDIYGNMTSAAPRPPGFKGTGSDVWVGISETNAGLFNLIQASGGKMHNLITALYLGDGLLEVVHQAEGADWWWGMGSDRATVVTQTDFIRMVTFEQEQTANWSDDFTLVPVEGKVYRLGDYKVNIVPQWTDEEIENEGEAQPTAGYSVVTPVCTVPIGFIAPETANGEDGPFEMKDPSKSHIEFSADGMIQYELLDSSIPAGVKAFLYRGNIYAEYVGKPEIKSPNIDFNIINNNLLGDQYAIIKVVDWVGKTSTPVSVTKVVDKTLQTFSKFLWKPVSESNGKLVVLFSPNSSGNVEIFGPTGEKIETGSRQGASNGYSETVRFSKPGRDYPAGSYIKVGNYGCKINNTSSRVESCTQVTVKTTVQDTPQTNTNIKEQAFQVRLKGNSHNCFLDDGTEGFTGRQFVPRLLFDWSWENISMDQCDNSNNNYTYCDATQFTISLFKRLHEIEQQMNANNLSGIARNTAFYAYLIKDNYSDNFLADFDSFYSNQLAITPQFFLDPSNGFNKFIKENKISFETDLGNTLLPAGGLYRVEIEIQKDNEGINSMLDTSGTNATINVRFRFVDSAPDYNPFYELPFDGEIGGNAREDYGVSINNGELKLNSDGVNSKSYDSALKSISYNSSTSLDLLNNNPVMTFKNDTLNFYPSQPTPVIMKISSNNGVVNSAYKYDGATTSANKQWKLYSSTMGTVKECVDFENNAIKTFNETTADTGDKTLSWNGSTGGEIGLSTIFFTPNSSNLLKITPTNNKTELFSIEGLKNADSVFLNYYDFAKVESYETLRGVFDLIAQEKMCMTKNSTDEMKIWWNPEYLNELINTVKSNVKGKCR